MRLGLLAEKVGMSRFFDENRTNHCVTLLKVNDCKVIAVKDKEKHGYSAVTLGLGKNSKKVNKPFKSFLKKNNLMPFLNSREFRVDESANFKVGDDVNVSNFIVGQFVDVSANSIGKGFAGGMKRHNFAGNRATHGVSISHRSHGSTGQCQDPGKVFKGKKMAGRLGNKKVTVQNLKVLNVDLDNNLLVVQGAVPGHKGSIIKIVDSIKKNQNIELAPLGSSNDGSSEVNENFKTDQNSKVDETKNNIQKNEESKKNEDTSSSMNTKNEPEPTTNGQKEDNSDNKINVDTNDIKPNS